MPANADIIRQRLAELTRGKDHEFLAGQIFAELLNYPTAFAPLPCARWKPDVAGLVRDGWILNAAGDFKIVYCQIDRLRKGDERPIIKAIRHDTPYFLTVFANRDRSEWEFVSPRFQDGKTEPLLRFLRIRNDNRHHTAAQILWSTEYRRGMAPIELQAKYDIAFDKEVVTKAFFEDFRDVFGALATELERQNPSFNAFMVEALAQDLLDRLLFLYFVQRKGWLDGDPDYLPNRFAPYHAASKETTFYSEFLLRLFQKLSIPQRRAFEAKDVGFVPFLNGGLFDFDPLVPDVNSTVWMRLKIRTRRARRSAR